jgi:hypothetical protein
MRNIVFLVQDDNCGATFMLGKMVKHALDQFNIKSEIRHINNFTLDFSAVDTLKDSLVFVYKHVPHKLVLNKLKENNNKLVMDVVDEYVRPGTTPEDLYSYEFFDGIILRMSRVLKEYTLPSHLEIKTIPHHWDIRLQNLDTTNKPNPKPVVTINDGRDMPYLQDLLKYKDVEFLGNFSYSQFSELTDKLNSYAIHYNVRNTDSPAYKFKPATKLVTAAVLDTPLITNYDWAIQDLIPSDYPFLTEGKDYGEIANLINTFPGRGSKEHNYALEILKEVKVKTALVNLIPEYLEFYKRF